MTLECNVCSNYQDIEPMPDAAIETVPCGECGTELCESCDRFQCDDCAGHFCHDHRIAVARMKLCPACALAMIEENEAVCTCSRMDVDMDDVRGCDLHDDDSEYQRLRRQVEDRQPARRPAAIERKPVAWEPGSRLKVRRR